MKENTLVAVYGTLRKGFGNHALLQNAEFVGQGKTTERFIMRASGIPFVSREQKVSPIVVEVYSVDPIVLKSLDRLEGCVFSEPENSWYYREFTEVALDSREHIQAMIYLTPGSGDIVQTGDYKDAGKNREGESCWYFAYGSNMDPERMTERGVWFTERKAARLPDFHLRFNKRALAGGVYANAMHVEGKFCRGILYKIQAETIALLDRREGSPWHYERNEINVETAQGEVVKAWVYLANPRKICEEEQPAAEYLRHVLRGKDLLGDEFLRCA